MSAVKSTADVGRLVSLLDEAYNRRSWHGTNLRGSIRGLSAGQAAWRTGRHSIAEIVVHCAYWKYAARRRLRGEKRGSFPLQGSNWFKLPDPLTDAAWRQYVALLEDQHAQLWAALADVSGPQLVEPEPGRSVSTLMLLRGVAMHDVYHAGQIQMIKGVHKKTPSGE